MYELLRKNKLVSFPPKTDSLAIVDSTISSITNLHFGVDIYPTRGEKAVAHLYFLIKNHPFTDGNKRTASIAFMTVSTLNGFIPEFKNFGLDELAVFIERIPSSEDHQRWIKVIANDLQLYEYPDSDYQEENHDRELDYK
jgi:prophage maintenance system killer protein